MEISSKTKVVLTWASLLIMIIPVSIWILWICVFENNTSASQQDKVKLFNSYLPGLSNNNISEIILLSSVFALVCALVSVNVKLPGYKIINLLVIILSSLLFLLTLFSLL